ncbi:MAG: NAD(P)H-binding protein [bacterium]|nr:NAD(P)H-binding protein [bacterium]
MSHADQAWIIYGANGYTGRLAVREAVKRGMRPILAGRKAHVINALADEHGLEARVFDLEDTSAAAAHMEDADVVLHCAGPFSATAEPMLDACEGARTHYLDITGEIGVFEYVHNQRERWEAAGIMALPGIGFDVVPTDCLAAMLKGRLPDAAHLRLAFGSGLGKMSPGTTKTVLEGLPHGAYVRQDGVLTTLPLAAKTARIPFPKGEGNAVVISWGDVSTAYYSTGIPNIEVYMGAGRKQVRQLKMFGRFRWLLRMGIVQRWLKRAVERNIQGPTDEERASDRSQLYGDVTNAAGDQIAIAMETPNGYTLTVDSSLRAVERILAGEVRPGAMTPSMAFGAEFVLELPGVECGDVVGRLN